MIGSRNSWQLVGGLLLLAMSAQAQAPDGDSVAMADFAVATRGFDAPVFAPQDAEPEPSQFAGIIEAHNHWRREVGADEIEGWSSEAAAIAQAWADTLKNDACQMRHNPAPERRQAYGENIYRYWRTSNYLGYKRQPEYVVNAWGSERDWYDPKTNECNAPDGATCGHYTQLVWSNSRLIGCGRAHCGTSEVWVCNYYPRGNYIGMRPYDLMARAMPASMPEMPEEMPQKLEYFGEPPAQGVEPKVEAQIFFGEPPKQSNQP